MLTYSDIITTCQDAVGDTSATIKTFLKQRINARYKLAANKLNTWSGSTTRTATTKDDHQYYYNPPNLREIESIVVTIDSQDYPLISVDSQDEWDLMNSVQIATGSFPTHYFRRANDYGIFPIPQADGNTITITYTQRSTPLYFEDYITGTVTATENDQTITVAGGANLTTGGVKPGFWFSLSDGGEPRGTWYRIGSVTDTTNLELETFFEEATESGSTYIIGQVPDLLPDEGHDLLALGAIADFYGLKTKDMETYTRFNNMFYTGTPNTTPLQAKNEKDLGGLLGLVQSYKDRDNSVIVNSRPTKNLYPQRWSSSIS